MIIKDTLLAFTAFFALVIAVFVLLSNKKKEASVALSLVSAWVSLWSLGIFLFRIVVSSHSAYFWNQEFIVAASLIANSFLHFSFVYPSERIQMTYVKRFLLYSPVVFVLLGVLVPGVLIDSVVEQTWGRESILGFWYPMYGLYFGALMIWAFINLYKSRRSSSDAVERVRIAVIILGLLLATVFGTTFNLFFILLGNYQYIWLGPYSAFILVLTIIYAVYRHGFLNIRIVATELFSAAVAIVLFVELLLSQTLGEVLIRGLLLAAFVYLSFALIKSVLREVSAKERIQHLNEKLQRANIEIKKVYKAKSEFLDIASHQLRTPVTVIVGTLDMFREGSVEHLPKEKRDEMLRRAYLKAEKLNSIVADVLSAAEMDVPKFDVVGTSRNVDLREVLKKVVRLNEDEVKASGLSLKVDLPDTLPLVYGSEPYLAQAVTNFITNAVKYTDKGSITVSVKQDAEDVVVTVTDTGIGVPKEHIPRLFEKFSRAHNARSKLPDGSGLGLFIVRKIIEGHKGGRVFVESEEGKGSTFGFRLPIIVISN